MCGQALSHRPRPQENTKGGPETAACGTAKILDHRKPAEQLQGRRPAIAEDEDDAGEQVVLKGLLTESRQTIDPASEIDHSATASEDLHLGRDLEHQRAFPKPRASASRSAAS